MAFKTFWWNLGGFWSSRVRRGSLCKERKPTSGENQTNQSPLSRDPRRLLLAEQTALLQVTQSIHPKIVKVLVPHMCLIIIRHRLTVCLFCFVDFFHILWNDVFCWFGAFCFVSFSLFHCLCCSLFLLSFAAFLLSKYILLSKVCLQVLVAYLWFVWSKVWALFCFNDHICKVRWLVGFSGEAVSSYVDDFLFDASINFTHT